MKTHSTRPEEITRRWHVIDASSKPLGRLASEVAGLLRGKHKPNYAPHLDMGDYVIVVNAAQIQVTGRKLRQKLYYRHSSYPGGLRSVWLERLLQTKPERVMEQAVRGMLPKTKLGRQMYRKLKVYPGPNHPHEAQVIGSQRVQTPGAQATPSRPVEVSTQPAETRPAEAPVAPGSPSLQAETPVAQTPEAQAASTQPAETPVAQAVADEQPEARQDQTAESRPAGGEPAADAGQRTQTEETAE